MNDSKMTKQEALDLLMKLKDHYEASGETFVVCLQDKENDGAWLYFNRLREKETKQLVKTIDLNVDLHFESQKDGLCS